MQHEGSYLEWFKSLSGVAAIIAGCAGVWKIAAKLIDIWRPTKAEQLKDNRDVAALALQWAESLGKKIEANDKEFREAFDKITVRHAEEIDELYKKHAAETLELIKKYESEAGQLKEQLACCRTECQRLQLQLENLRTAQA